MTSCVEYRIIDKKRGVVVREASACSEEELELVKTMVNLVNKKYGMNFEITTKPHPKKLRSRPRC